MFDKEFVAGEDTLIKKNLCIEGDNIHSYQQTLAFKNWGVIQNIYEWVSIL